MKRTIRRLGHLGDGVADGPVFVPRTLPGEIVEGEVACGRMPSPRIATPSPERIAAPCPHYRTCGGCSLQHASDAFVETWKTDVVRSALDRQGIDATIRGIVTSPPRSRRRATLHGRRLRKGVLVGFNSRASDTITAVPQCHLVRPAILAAIPSFEALISLGASRKAEIDLAVLETEAGLDVSVSEARPLDREGLVAAVQIAEAGDLARLSWNGDLVAERRVPVIRFGRASVAPPPGAFLQATAAGEAALVSAVRDAVGGASRIVDLFAGCGTFSLPLAENAGIHAVEGGAAMLAALDRGWRQTPDLKRVTMEARDLFRRPLLPDEVSRFDAAVIDPPRAGAEAQTHELAASTVSRVAAVSCNPVTFARDARLLLEGGFRLDWVQVVDQFRWSPHVELAACFSRDHMA